MNFREFSTKSLDERKKIILEIISQNRVEIDSLVLSDKNSFKEFIRVYAELGEKLNEEFTELSHLHSVMNDEEIQKIYTDLLPELTSYYTDLGQNLSLYHKFLEIQKSESLSLTQAQQKTLKDAILSFELSGVALPEEKKSRFKEIQMELSQLSNDFSQNVLNATKNFSIMISDETLLGDMPSSDREIAKSADGYTFSLQGPSYISFMTYVTDRTKREEVYKAYSTRAPENGPILEKILQLRHEEAKLLGYSNFAELSLASKVANTPNQVIEFLENLGKKAKPFAEKDLKELQEFANSYGIHDLKSFDLMFYSEKLKKEKYHFNEEDYRPYLEKNSVIKGMFEFLTKFLGIEFHPLQRELYHPSANLIELKRNGKTFARLFVDMESREVKKSGAWMHNWQTHRRDSHGTEHPATAFIVGNFPPSLPNSPSLLRPSDVVTLFHEMGHALHHLMSQVEEASVSGVNGVEWDAVEFPSQWLENFVYSEHVIPMIAKHYQTGEVLPKALLANWLQVKNFQAGMATVRQIEFGLFDMKIHQRPMTEEEVHNTLVEVRNQVAVSFPPDYNRFQNQFSHIFAGGYAAGYYSYKWAELLSAEAFFAFENKKVFDQDLANRFIDSVLSKGGSANAMEIFKGFLGRDPKVEALLELYGLK
jgi:oligopeptidase A